MFLVRRVQVCFCRLSSRPVISLANPSSSWRTLASAADSLSFQSARLVEIAPLKSGSNMYASRPCREHSTSICAAFMCVCNCNLYYISGLAMRQRAVCQRSTCSRGRLNRTSWVAAREGLAEDLAEDPAEGPAAGLDEGGEGPDVGEGGRHRPLPSRLRPGGSQGVDGSCRCGTTRPGRP